MSTPETRNAKRDYWTSPRVARNCQRLDMAYVYFLFAVIVILGSISPR